MFITRNYNSDTVVPGLATLFFINDRGDALTCKHVAGVIMGSESINKQYKRFKEELQDLESASSGVEKKELRLLEQKYHLGTMTPVNRKCQFFNIPSPMKGFSVHVHPKYDFAVIHFNGFEKLNYSPENIFFKEDESEIMPGRSMCRLGFPFPEYRNYKYDPEKNVIFWTGPANNVPAFPIDGIMTRHIGDADGNIFGIEMSTPGLRGQSGGPLFDTEGRICGMQFATNHLHLGFDMVNTQIKVNGEERTINNQPFFHVGQCIHVHVIKEFLQEQGIPFRTA